MELGTLLSRVYRKAHSRFGYNDEWESIANTAVFRAIRTHDDTKRVPLEAWAWCLTRQDIIKSLRHTAREQLCDMSTAEIFARQSLGLYEILDRLPGRMGEVAYSYYVDRYSVAEVCKRLHISTISLSRVCFNIRKVVSEQLAANV